MIRSGASATGVVGVVFFDFAHGRSPLGLHLSKWICHWVAPKRALREGGPKARARIVRRGVSLQRPVNYNSLSPKHQRHGERAGVRGNTLFCGCSCPSPRPSPRKKRGEGENCRLFDIPEYYVGTLTAPPHQLQPRSHHLGLVRRLVRPGCKRSPGP